MIEHFTEDDLTWFDAFPTEDYWLSFNVDDSSLEVEWNDVQRVLEFLNKFEHPLRLSILSIKIWATYMDFCYGSLFWEVLNTWYGLNLN